jgi:asparagine synthase (glutamine-hydrolysing)
MANGDAEFGHHVAGAVGLPNHQVLFDAGRTPGVDEWKRLLWLLETPLCNAEQYYKHELYRYAKSIRPELRGMLLGQASDEYNGGYSALLSNDTDWPGFEAGVRQMARATALPAKPGLASWWDLHESPLLSDHLLRSDADRMLGDPYAAYVAAKHRDVQQYNCWHEDRTAAGNGIEARVPFLDHRIIELMATIPPERRASLLWDKRILRDAVRDVLPAAIVDRPKVSFFYGAGEAFTHRMLVRMLAQDGAALLEEALSAPGARDFLRPGPLRTMLRRLTDEAEPFDVEFLIRLVNLGLLDQMTRRLPARPIEAPCYDIVPPLTIDDWDLDTAAVAERMRRLPEPSAEDLLAYAEGVLLVTSPADPDTLYVAVDGSFEYVATTGEDASWCAVLRAIDGRRTLAEVLTLAGAERRNVMGTLRDAIDAGVISVTPTAARRAPLATRGAGS